MALYQPNFATVGESGAAAVSGDFPGSATGGGARYANGRVDLLSPMPTMQIPSYAQSSSAGLPPAPGAPGAPACDQYRKQALTGTLTSTPVSDLYFSDENLGAVQEGIRYRIYRETNGKHIIGRQSDTELRIIMRSIFLTYSRNMPGDVVAQVRELNRRVLEWAVPEVLSNLKQHITYMRDASTLPMPLERGELMTTKGSRTLETKRFI